MIQFPILPIVPVTRFGFTRTTCDCAECVLCCLRQPGNLIPADLERIRQYVTPGETLEDFAVRSLLASPGAIAVRPGRPPFRIRTIIPDRTAAHGGCVFLTDRGQCGIHPVAPYGCAFVDPHMDVHEAHERSRIGHAAILQDWNSGGPYSRLWRFLSSCGRVAPAPEKTRADFDPRKLSPAAKQILKRVSK